jgi:hypothetical protein
VQAELGLGLCDQALRTTRELIKANPNGEGAIKAYVLRAKAPLYLLWPYSPCPGAALLTLRTSHFFQLTSYFVQALPLLVGPGANPNPNPNLNPNPNFNPNPNQALLFSSDLEQSAKHLREALRLDPDAAEAGRALKKVRGREP